MKNSEKRYGAVDGLKYILMLLVISCHYYNSLAFSDDNLPHFLGSDFFFHYSYLAVEIFFLISGFFMAYTIRRKENSLSYFIKKRIKRLYPLAIISTVFICLIGLLDTIFVHAISLEYDIWTLFLSVTGMTRWLSNEIWIYNGPLWYIQILVLCEIFLFVIYFKKMNRSGNVLEAYILIAYVGLELKIVNLNIPFVNESVMLGMFNYFLGATLYECTRRKINWKNISIIFAIISLIILGIGIRDNSAEHIGNFQLCVSFIISPVYFE